MPLGKSGRGIESFSALKDPGSSPISNYFCKGYSQLQQYPFENPYGKMNKRNKGEAYISRLNLKTEKQDTACTVDDIGR